MAQTNKFRQLLDLGYDQLLCVIPPGAPVREAGKRPGRKDGGTWYGAGVRTFVPADTQDADLWHSWGGGAGIRCNGKFLAIDIDSLSPEWAGKIHKAALKVLGPAPVRIGRAPKCLLVYRAADDVSYRNVRFDDGMNEEKPGLVECLSGGDGTKWFVAFGTHKDTGKPYVWPDGIPHAHDLTRVSEAQVAAFFERLRNDLPKAKGAASASATDREQVDQNKLKAADLDEMERALNSIVNTTDAIDYFKWVELAAAVRGAFQDDPDRGMDLFCELSERAGIDDPTEDPARTYNSIKPPFGLGADYILAMAERIGTEEFKAQRTQQKAEHWFDDLDDNPNPFAEQIDLNALKEKSDRFKPIGFFEAADSALDDLSSPLIKGLLDQSAMSVLYGDSNVGKTFVAMDMAYHIAAGLPYAGMRTQQMAVLYVAMEGQKGASRRIQALREKFRPTEEPPFLLLKSAVDLRRPEIDLNAFIAMLKAVDTHPYKIGLVVVDTLARAMAGGDENSVVDMGAVVTNVGAVQAAIDTHVMIVHHTGKDKAKGARGHSSLRAATDTELEVSDGLISVTKQRDLDKSWSSAFSLNVHRLGLDREGDPITSCTVRLDAASAVRRREATEGELAVLEAIETIADTSDRPEKGARTKDLEAWCKDNLSGMTRDTLNQHIRGLRSKSLISQKVRGFWLSERKTDCEEMLGDSEGNIFA